MTESANGNSPATDAWTFALNVSRDYFAARAARELPIAFAAEANRLGQALREFHETLAGDESDQSDDSAGEPALPEDLEGWVECARRSVNAGLMLLERQWSAPSFPKTRVAEAQALVRRREAYLARIEEIADALDEDLGVRIHVHGKLGLESIARAPNGVFTIAAPGTRAPSAERTSPLSDVAAMLRSFGYASATLVASVEKTSDLATRELRAGRWERDVRAGFLAGYTGGADEDTPGILPEQPQNVLAMIALFETEKAFAELSEELTNRPSSVWIPMRGIAKLLTR